MFQRKDFEYCNLFQLPNATFDAVSHKNAVRICNFLWLTTNGSGDFENN